MCSITKLQYKCKFWSHCKSHHFTNHNQTKAVPSIWFLHDLPCWEVGTSPGQNPLALHQEETRRRVSQIHSKSHVYSYPIYRLHFPKQNLEYPQGQDWPHRCHLCLTPQPQQTLSHLSEVYLKSLNQIFVMTVLYLGSLIPTQPVPASPSWTPSPALRRAPPASIETGSRLKRIRTSTSCAVSCSGGGVPAHNPHPGQRHHSSALPWASWWRCRAARCTSRSSFGYLPSCCSLSWCFCCQLLSECSYWWERDGHY